MADYKFPNVSFDWLGNLPGTARAAGLEFARRDALAGLDSTSPASMDKAAARLAQAGDLEGAAKIYGLSTARSAVYQRSANDELYKQLLPALLGKGLPGGVTAPAGGTFTYEPPGSSTEPAPSEAPPAWTPPPWPTSAVEPPTANPQVASMPVQPLPPVPPTTEGPVPPVPPATEGQISSALAPPPPVPPGLPQVAQAGPGPLPAGTLPPEAPQAPSPAPGFDPRFSIIPSKAAPLTTGAAQTTGPAPQTTQLPTSAVNPETAKATLDNLHRQILAASAAGRGHVPPTLIAAFNHTLAMSNASPEERKYQLDQLQNQILGLPRTTRQDWENLNKDYPARAADFRGAFNKYRESGLTARDSIDAIESLQKIMDSKAYMSGFGTEPFTILASGLSAVRQQLISAGVDPSILPDMSGIRETTRLGEAFNAIKSQVVFKSLGGLGSGRSDSDRKYTDRTFGTLNTSTEGNQLIAEYNLQRAKQAEGAWQAAAEYSKKYGETRGTVTGMDDAVQKYLNANPLLGEDSPLRKRMDEVVKNLHGEGRAYEPIIQKVTEATKSAGESVQEAINRGISNFNEAGNALNRGNAVAQDYGKRVNQFVMDLYKNDPAAQTILRVLGGPSAQPGAEGAAAAVTPSAPVVPPPTAPLPSSAPMPSPLQPGAAGPGAASLPPPAPMAPVVQPGAEGPSGSVPQAPQIIREKSTGKRAFLMPDGRVIPLPDISPGFQAGREKVNAARRGGIRG